MNTDRSFRTSAQGKQTPIARIAATLGAACQLPLRIICLGEAHYLDGDQGSCAYSAPRTVMLSEADSLAGAMASVQLLACQGRFGAIDDSAVGFTPRLFMILDDEQRQVIAGEPDGRGIRWCEPVASDGEARSVVAEASKRRGEALREAAANRHDVARTLRLRAAVIEGRLVHPDWRQAARAAWQLVALPRAA